MFKTATLLFGALVLPLASCTAEMDQENVSDTYMSFEEFEAQTYREPDTGIYIVDGDIPTIGPTSCGARSAPSIARTWPSPMATGRSPA
ncbi:hypothetical protein [Polyangium mundeleinium]|uniref:Secreted protein n=1 Tax=Polyangium mundeleinium TaxID=2995306 RepID=A0ABT5F2I3_9BACT|nr:hypothetical protein [Polyangium mundeleinium]MDC0748307.1 hypothetical protein [Polyangium mundeleinium]